MYIAVAEETCGGIPRLSSKGLKIIPPPIPTIVAIVAPTNEKIASFITPLTFQMKSVSKY